MKRYEVWAKFNDGLNVLVETHKTENNARAAVDAMNNQNRRDIAEGYGFTHGVPKYYIVKQ